ncbi:peptidase [Paremcibacter congregatus]|nr:peptidase [Paremcibacter congregatus]
MKRNIMKDFGLRKHFGLRKLAILGLMCGTFSGIVPGQLQAQADFDKPFYPETVKFNAAIPKPATMIGHPLGHRVARNDLLVRYLTDVANISDRVTSEVIAYSHEGRPIVMLTITSPENHARIDDIREAHNALRGKDAPASIPDDMPVVTWLNYGVHGAEVSSTDAVLPVVYHLAAAEGPEIEKTLKKSVILVIASFNPDGSSRQSAWNHMHGADVPVTNPDHRLHNTFWPGGRTNHYWFDLNRQWLLLQHPEAKGWVEKFHQWRPNINADYHEMATDKTYYFHPGAADRTHPLIPQKSMALLDKVADRPRAFMDGEQRLYFSEEGYDNFYLGKGSTYPHVHGTVGVLFEQAHSDGFKDSDYGVVSFRDNIRTHYRTSLEIVRAGVELRPELLKFQKSFGAETRELAAKDKVKGYIFAAPKDPARIYHALDLLNRHQIAVKRTTKDVTVNKKLFRAGQSYLVETNQAQYRLIKGLFGKITTFENNTFYDVSGWTLPLAFDLDYAEVSGKNIAGEILGTPKPVAAPVPEKAGSGYLFSWHNYYAPKALYRLQNAGYLPRVATKPFEIETAEGIQKMDRGSIMVPVGRQGGHSDQDLHKIMTQIAQEDGVKIHSVGSVHTPTQGMDLGSLSFSVLKAPKVLLLTGEGIASYDAGEVWHLLDKRMKMPVTMIDKQNLAKINLANFTHVILVGGNHKDLKGKVADQINNWVKQGGTLVAHRQGAKWAYDSLLADKKDAKKDAKKEAADKTSTAPERLLYGDKVMNEVQDIIGGAVMAGDLDITHPIGYGVSDRDIASHRNTLLAFDAPKNPYATVVRIKENALLSGYASEKNQKKLAGKTMLLAERHGKGSVVLFTDNPNFRAYFYGTNKLFMNSLFFSKVFDKPRKAK